MKKQKLDRRGFIKHSALGIAGAGILNQGEALLTTEEETTSGLKIKNYRTLGRTGFKVSDISSGGPENEAVLNQLLDAGVNYIDTAESYNMGQSERIIGRVIKNRDRKSLFITTKLMCMGKVTKESILKRTRQCLDRFQTDYIDCVMLHSVLTAEKLKSPGFHEAMKQLKTEGKVRFIGLSNHGSSFPSFGMKGEPMEKVLMAAANDGRFDVVLMVHNFLTRETSEKILKVYKDKNIGVTLMKINPVGDYLTIEGMIKKYEDEKKQVPPQFKIMKENFKKQADQVKAYLKVDDFKNPAKIREAAFRFALDNSAVHTVCCGCRNFDDVEKFLKLSGMPFTKQDEKTLGAYKQGFGSLYCRHGCGLCESQCPSNVPVNTIMRYNHYFVSQGREKYAMLKYQKLDGNQASQCSQCPGFCEKACPYNVPIQGLLHLAHQNLTLA
jgi:predicted aldo/keto reductase-like oxidoreductase